ncbi:MAG: helix-turn-helix domain-containing protein [Thermoplasmata archaeon]|nr:MAG: helix-turn-helix domain-containing protein [Thermoplasmata archaeon]
MTYLDTWVRVRHECPYCELSDRYPDAQMTLWLSVLVDMLQISIPDNYDIEELITAAWETLDFSDEFHDAESAILLITHPWIERADSVVAIASEEECLLIPPVSFNGGWETHRVICKEQDQLRTLMDRVGARGSAELISQRKRELADLVRDVHVVPTHFIEGLTPRQVSVIVNSYEQGLYDIPARTKMDKVAKRAGLSRSTFGEHLQKGELQIMRNLYPLLKVRSHQDERDVTREG